MDKCICSQEIRLLPSKKRLLLCCELEAKSASLFMKAGNEIAVGLSAFHLPISPHRTRLPQAVRNLQRYCPASREMLVALALFKRRFRSPLIGLASLHDR